MWIYHAIWIYTLNETTSTVFLETYKLWISKPVYNIHVHE